MTWMACQVCGKGFERRKGTRQVYCGSKQCTAIAARRNQKKRHDRDRDKLKERGQWKLSTG